MNRGKAIGIAIFYFLGAWTIFVLVDALGVAGTLTGIGLVLLAVLVTVFWRVALALVYGLAVLAAGAGMIYLAVAVIHYFWRIT